MEGDCNVYAHSSLWMRPTRPDRYNAKMVYCGYNNVKPIQTLCVINATLPDLCLCSMLLCTFHVLWEFLGMFMMLMALVGFPTDLFVDWTNLFVEWNSVNMSVSLKKPPRRYCIITETCRLLPRLVNRNPIMHSLRPLSVCNLAYSSFMTEASTSISEQFLAISYLPLWTFAPCWQYHPWISVSFRR